jgi:Zn-dependent peptidase ImmA (M78 family)/transcriptional regulator with XRE-family HTH domain
MRAGSPGFIGGRLRQAREARGLTITSLAELLEVSKQAVSQYENGLGTPRAEVLAKAASVLKVPSHFFLKPLIIDGNEQAVFYRSMSAATKTARARAEVRYSWAREIVSQVREYVDLPAVTFPKLEVPSDLSQFSPALIESLAVQTRQYWRLGDSPIPHLIRTVESNGAIVVVDALDASTLDALSQWAMPEDLPFVMLNDEKESAVRSRLDLAHEIGHLVMHRRFPQDYLRRTPQFREMEQQAFRFGAALLLPEKPFLDDLYSVSLESFRLLKAKWKVSIGMMIRRVQDLGIVDETAAQRLWMNYSRRGWRLREPQDDELPIESPSLLSRAIEFLFSEHLQDREQFFLEAALDAKDIARLSGLPANAFLPTEPAVNRKVLEFKKG